MNSIFICPIVQLSFLKILRKSMITLRTDSKEDYTVVVGLFKSDGLESEGREVRLLENYNTFFL